ncbi:hypothetical protein [Clostridium transplantifaecale]|uniref:hypothetical protein n=1 Tax=Clostridium transplantifaecale TaxID=2479838 RepID=UPI000F6437AD|nr:hypothetical protein [Clostridium transplantifaecale]
MNSKRNIKKGLACIGLGLLFILILCMDVAVFYLEHVLYQDIMTTGMTVWQHCLHFIVICTVWGCGSMALCGLAKEKELLPDSKNNVKRLSGSRIFMLVLIAAAGILFMSLDMPGMSLRLKPLSELHYFLKQYGRAGTAAFLLQHLYYLFESVIILFLVVFGQQAGELLFPFRRTRSVLWGGIFCAMTWGMLHGLTKDWETAVFCILLSVFFNLSYLAADRRLIPAYHTVAAIFVI